MDMKVSGMYIARQLSFSGVSFRIEEISLDEDFKLVYNKAAKLVREGQRLGLLACLSDSHCFDSNSPQCICIQRKVKEVKLDHLILSC